MFYTTGDECAYSNEHVLPVEYESVEAAKASFQEESYKAYFSHLKTFRFSGHRFDAEDFHDEWYGYHAPQFLTLDEWFAEPQQ